MAAVLGVLAAGNEYHTGMMRTTLAAMPRRSAVLTAKAAVLTAVMLVAGTLAVAGSVLYLLLIALLSLGTVTALRNSATATGVVLALLFVFPILIKVISNPDWQRHLQRIAPMPACLEVQATVNTGQLAIGPWQGLGVLALWAVGALLVGGVTLQLRDA
ncbi:hypothetical protein ABT095_35365 [Kitasatospora sp. NPDC002227]|uniref:hypothetical protein n=1 Tax=Kitasatospora sp. NPDC002227 TaxID=3154773 RepID=UPI00331A11A0